MLAKLREKNDALKPMYARRGMSEDVEKYRLAQSSMSPDVAASIIRDELMLDGNAKLNLATFVTTWMEPEAKELMAESFEKNMIDKDEYPQTAEIEERCVNIISDLFHAPQEGVGVSAIGSSEAVMLAGLACKWRWRQRCEKEGKDTTRPNIVLGSNVQVVWEKFCRYFDVEPKYIKMKKGKYVITPEEVEEICDENTICVVAILGTTFTGEFEPIEAINETIKKINKKNSWYIPLHVDAASGGFVAPFIHPHLKWDFRLSEVKSINVSGHKYGLVYPGVGWVLWRDKEELPEELVFHVNYLGGDMPTFTLNFSRPGNQIIGQYYNFLRLGFEGYRDIMSTLSKIAQHTAKSIEKMGCFELLSDGSAIPVFAFKLVDGMGYSVYDISDRLRMHGWQVPAYTMPEDATDVEVLRAVIREGFNYDMSEMLLEHIKECVEYFEKRETKEKKAFSH
ncbi:MAG: glutamate decarboxylase [Campylobacterales bacterium]